MSKFRYFFVLFHFFSTSHFSTKFEEEIEKISDFKRIKEQIIVSRFYFKKINTKTLTETQNYKPRYHIVHLIYFFI